MKQQEKKPPPQKKKIPLRVSRYAVITPLPVTPLRVLLAITGQYKMYAKTWNLKY